MKCVLRHGFALLSRLVDIEKAPERFWGKFTNKLRHTDVFPIRPFAFDLTNENNCNNITTLHVIKILERLWRKMDISKAFNCIIIDTCAFENKGNDFIGAINPIIPSLFSAVKNNGLQLLSHPVLQEETKKHIYGEHDGSIQKKVDNAKDAIKKHQGVLKLIDIDTESVFSKLNNLQLPNKEYSAFSAYYQDAVPLPYGDPHRVFENYFSSNPPFAQSGKKKAEFPDAFVIDSLSSYLVDHPGMVVLVVTNDNDWKKALDNIDRVVVCDSIDDAINAMNGQALQMETLFPLLKANIDEFMREKIDQTWFKIRDYPDAEDLGIFDLRVASVEKPVILYSSEKEKTIQVTTNLLANGSFIYLNTDGSIWDSKTRNYVFTVYTFLGFEAARGTAVCTVLLTSDEQCGWKVNGINIITQNGIELMLDGAKTRTSDIFEEDDLSEEEEFQQRMIEGIY